MNVPQPDYQTPERMALKQQAIPLPDFAGLRVLDIGCDHAHWTLLAAEMGATEVLGIDRNRLVKGRGFVDLISENTERAKAHPYGKACRFVSLELGKQWHNLGRFDIALMMSVYHHVYECAGGDHEPIWYWLWRHLDPGGMVLWENPVDISDSVVRRNVTAAHHSAYNRANILNAAERYFRAEHIGPALHEPTREVWRFTRLALAPIMHRAVTQDGAGGAGPAFTHAGGRRIQEIAAVLGIVPVPGSLNCTVMPGFDWQRGYYRAPILDVTIRGKGFDVEWASRWARFYPARIASREAFAFRFEGEKYPSDFVELVAAEGLRDHVGGRAFLCR